MYIQFTGCESCRYSYPQPPEEAGLIIAGEVIKDLKPALIWRYPIDEDWRSYVIKGHSKANTVKSVTQIFKAGSKCLGMVVFNDLG